MSECICSAILAGVSNGFVDRIDSILRIASFVTFVAHLTRLTRGLLCTHRLTDDLDTPVMDAVFLTDFSLRYALTQMALASSE